MKFNLHWNFYALFITAVPQIKTNLQYQILKNEFRRFIFIGRGLFLPIVPKSGSELSRTVCPLILSDKNKESSCGIFKTHLNAMILPPHPLRSHQELQQPIQQPLLIHQKMQFYFFQHFNRVMCQWN